jgi:hypothetical protein
LKKLKRKRKKKKEKRREERKRVSYVDPQKEKWKSGVCISYLALKNEKHRLFFGHDKKKKFLSYMGFESCCCSIIIE